MRQRASKLLVVGATTCCAAAMVDHAASEAVENLIASSVSRVAEKVEAANAPAVTVVAAPRGMPHSRVRAVTGADAALVIDRVSAGSWGRSVWRALVEDEPRSNLEKLVLLLAVRSRAAYSAMSDGEAREKLGQALRGAARPVHLWVELSGEASLSELQSLTAWGRELAAERGAVEPFELRHDLGGIRVQRAGPRAHVFDRGVGGRESGRRHERDRLALV